MSSVPRVDISVRRDQRMSTDPNSAALDRTAARPRATSQRDLVIASLLRFPERRRAAGHAGGQRQT